VRPTRFATEIGWLLQTGLIVFIVTPTIGIINGTKIFGTLSRDVLLTHVHSGTLGWITLVVMAVAAGEKVREAAAGDAVAARPTERLHPVRLAQGVVGEAVEGADPGEVDRVGTAEAENPHPLDRRA